MFLAKLGNLTSEVIFSIRLCVCLQSVGGSVRPVSRGRRLQEKWLVHDARNDGDLHPVSGATRDHAQRTSNGPRSIHTQVSGPGPFCWSMDVSMEVVNPPDRKQGRHAEEMSVPALS